ncbi:hypothetical protein BOX15_Mlig002140g1 [Macrostomum lignano]|uniref:Chloride channel protein n=1 Tax=Macrostomum lignano TaxID=282301 RepID=A0A267EK11_9PLAT|nr:hypothetical protein BOX15_Mlig002140g1 [Macrostomum lignano]
MPKAAKSGIGRQETDSLVASLPSAAGADATAGSYQAFAPAPRPVGLDSEDSAAEEETEDAAASVGLLRDQTAKFPGTAHSDTGATGDGQYDDFETIDWLKDIGRHRRRRRELLRRARETWRGRLTVLVDGLSGWLCVGLIAIAAGLVAGIVDVGTAWMSDLREGICPGAFWLNREQCCWSANDTAMDAANEEAACQQWYPWPELFFDASATYPQNYALQYSLYVTWSLLFALLTATLVRSLAPYACGSGIPEIKTILSGFVIRGYLGWWTLLVKSLGIMLAVASGLSLGKEGPMVHMAACCGNIIARLFPKYNRNEAKKREVLSAAAAAGVSIAFGAPLGGVLFSLEEASYYFPLKTLWRSFFCSMVAASVLKLVNPFGNDHLVLFAVNYRSAWSALEVGPFVLLGILGGLFGAGFVKANVWLCRRRKLGALGRHPIAEVAAVASLTALAAFPNPYTRMGTARLVRLLFSRCGPEDVSELCDFGAVAVNGTATTGTGAAVVVAGDARLDAALWKLSIAYLFKIVATVFTFGIKVPSGLFIPSLAVGAIAGRIVGSLLEQLAAPNAAYFPFNRLCSAAAVAQGQPCVNSGLYAMVGAAAALGGVTRMTLSLVAIMLELTGGLEYSLPLMIAALTSKWVGDGLSGGGGIYEAHIRLNGYPFLASWERPAADAAAADVDDASALAGDVMRRPLRVLRQAEDTVDEINRLLAECQVNGFPVVLSADYHYLIGFVTRRDLVMAIEYYRKKDDSIVGQSVVYFADTPAAFADQPAAPNRRNSPKQLNLSRIVDLAPIAVTDQTPMFVVLEMFRKLGLRQTLVTRNGRLLGVITKKDALRYLENLS